jgi:hypothetical protein
VKLRILICTIKYLDHDDLGLNQSLSIPMFRWIDIDVMNVIFSKSLALDAGGKPGATFPHPALERDVPAAQHKDGIEPRRDPSAKLPIIF